MKLFSEKLKLYFPSIPPILTELDDLVDQNFRAGFQERMDGREFLSAIRKLYIDLFAGPVKGMDEKDRIACRDKVNNQLDQLRTLTSLTLSSLEKLESLDLDEKPGSGKKPPMPGFQSIKSKSEEKSQGPSSPVLTLSPPLSRNSQGSFAVNIQKNPEPSLSETDIPGYFH